MHKLLAPWVGSFIVTEVISPSTYCLQWADGQGVLLMVNFRQPRVLVIHWFRL
jgi:hypothetical protein